MKRLISVVLALTMAATALPVNVIADDMLLSDTDTTTEDVLEATTSVEAPEITAMTEELPDVATDVIFETETVLQEQPRLLSDTTASGTCGENVT